MLIDSAIIQRQVDVDITVAESNLLGQGSACSALCVQKVGPLNYINYMSTSSLSSRNIHGQNLGRLEPQPKARVYAIRIRMLDVLHLCGRTFLYRSSNCFEHVHLTSTRMEFC